MDKPAQIPISDSDWQSTPVAVQALVISLLHGMERVGHLEQLVEQQAARIASLETELARRKGRGSGGAKASTSGSQASRQSGKRKASGRSPGAQPGHEGHGRSLLSVAQVDEVVPVFPCACHRCGQALTGTDPHPLRHQVTEIPPVRAHVTEYQFHTLRCQHCDVLTEAPWPTGQSESNVRCYRFDPEGEERLSAWMEEHLSVGICPHPHPDQVEDDVIGLFCSRF